MSEVLLYNIEKQKELKIKMLCHKLNIGFRTVEKEEFGYRISYLLGLSADDVREEGEDFSEEMLLLSDIGGGMLNLFLTQLIRQKTPVALKAVRTDTNMQFMSYGLYRELSAEREAIQRGVTAHKPEE
ncbi:MAG: DUF3783 domain-containing protein [Ruminococcus sp.]|nr:DUF3783 domain-containing protein [Ruminococcus sp.]